MTTKELVRRLLQYWHFLLLLPLATAGSVYFFAQFQAEKYKSETTFYTGITSGYKITGAASTSNRDNEATLNAFDNLIALITSREVYEEVCLRLLAWQLLDEAQGQQAQQPSPVPGTSRLARVARMLLAPKATPYTQLLTPTLKSHLRGSTLAETTSQLMAYYRASATNEVQALLNSKDPDFSKSALARLVVKRLQNSDMLQLEYEASNPLRCQKTLELLTEVAMRRNKELFAGQGETVAAYFSQAARQAQARLQAAEQRQFAFEQQHNIVDYERHLSLLMYGRQATAAAYGDLEMQYAGAVATQQSAEATLRKSGVRNLQSQEIIDLRNRLADLASQAAEAAILLKAPPTAAQATQLASLRQQAAQVADKISEKVASYQRDSSLGPGFVTKGLLTSYSKATLRAENLRSQLGLSRQQRDLAARRYTQLVPLGVELAQIRREVQVAEQAYASQAEGLKKSRISQQNSALASQLRVVDPPSLPSTPLDSKTPMLLVGGLLAMLLLTGAVIATTGVLDTSLLDPAQAARATSFAVAGAVPVLTSPQSYELAQRAEDHMARQLLLQFQRQPKAASQPYSIGILSSHAGEGKTNLACNLAASLNEMGIRTLNMFPDDHRFHLIPNDDTLFYAPLHGLTPGVTVAELAGKKVYADEVVIIEFPAVSENAYPASVLRDLSLILVSVRAERNWQPADRAIFEHIRQATTATIELVLNGVMPEYVMDIIGSRSRPVRAPYVPPLPASPLAT